MDGERPASALATRHGGGRRANPRVPAPLDCELRWDHVSVSGSLIDLSLGGAAIEMKQPLPLADGAIVNFRLPFEFGSVAIEATVLTQFEESFGSFVARVKFSDGLVAGDLNRLVEECISDFRAIQVTLFQRHL